MTLSKKSIEMMNYFTLQLVLKAEENQYYEPGAVEPLTQMLLEQAIYWVNEVLPEASSEEKEIILDDLKDEIQEGLYLKDGVDAFLTRLKVLLGGEAKDILYYQLVKQALQK